MGENARMGVDNKRYPKQKRNSSAVETHPIAMGVRKKERRVDNLPKTSRDSGTTHQNRRVRCRIIRPEGMNPISVLQIAITCCDNLSNRKTTPVVATASIQ